MEFPQIKAFIDAIASSDLTELEATKDGWTLRLVRRTSQAASRDAMSGATSSPNAPQPKAGTAATVEDSDSAVRAPLSGTVYLNPSPDAAPFVVAGQAVKAGETLCVIEAMKVFNNICAERDGVVEGVVAISGHEVDAGQLLMRIA